MSPSVDVQISCFQLSCTGDSAALTMRVPICTPSAPSIIAAAIDRPSQMPPAAMIGTSTCDAINGSKHHGRRARRRLEAAAFVALDDEAVDAGVDSLQAHRATTAPRGTP